MFKPIFRSCGRRGGGGERVLVGGAIELLNFQCRGLLLILIIMDSIRARVSCVCIRCGWDCLDIFSLVYHFSLLLPFSLGDGLI